MFDIAKNKDYEDKYVPSLDVNPSFKDEKYFLEMMQGFYGAYLRGGTGISYIDRANIAYYRSYGKGNHDTSNVKTYLTGDTTHPESGVLSNFSQENDKTLVSLYKKAWDNVDWSPISPMPKIKSIISKLADIDYDVSCDAIDSESKSKEMDKKAYSIFFSKYGGFIKRYANNAGVPIDEPDIIPESEEELDMHDAEGGFKAIYAMHQEILIKYSMEIGDYDEIRSEHIDDMCDYGTIALKIEKDPNSGRLYPRYVDIENFFIQASSYPDFRDSEYAGEFDTITISQMISYGASKADVMAATKYFSGWRGNIKEADDLEYSDLTSRHNNMKVCVIRASWVDNDIYRYKNFTNKYGRKRYILQEEKEWGRVYDQPNMKTTETRGRVVREGVWVVGTSFVYGCGKVSNQARVDDRDVLIPYRAYQSRWRAMVPQCVPFINGFQIGWSKLQNAFIVAMNSGHALNVSMLQNLSYGGEPMDWLDALKVFRGIGVMPYMQSFSGRYEGGNPSPISKIEGGVGMMMEEAMTMMRINMENIHTVTGLNPLQLAESTDPNMPVRTSQMMMNATSDVLKPFVRASFKIKQDGAKVINAMLATCVQDKGYMRRAYGGILSDAAIDVLTMAKKHGVKYGLMLRVRPNDDEKNALLEMANVALQAGLITPDVNMYVKEKVLEGANLKRIRLWVSYKIEKERQRKHFEQMQIVKQQGETNKEYEVVKQQTIRLENDMKVRGELVVMEQQSKRDKDLEIERRLTELMKKAMDNEELRDVLLKEARKDVESTKGLQNAEAPAGGAGEAGISGAESVA